ncbi:hypothetical protein Tco_0737217 [Tanacetum coccineum]
MVNKGIVLDASLVSEESTDDNTSTKHKDEGSSSRYDADAKKAWVDKVVSKIKNVFIRPSYDQDTLTEQEINREDIFTLWNHEHKAMRKVRNWLSEEFEPLAKNIKFQLKCFEKSLIKEIKDDLKYVMSLEDEFDEKCLIMDIQTEFFKT